MRILHVLDHSLPLHSGYSFRTAAIIAHQRALGWSTFHLTGPRHHRDARPVERVEGWDFFRTPLAHRSPLAGLPVAREHLEMRALASRLEVVTEAVRPDVIHVHSPALNALPALRVARRRRIPVVYEVRAFWEDAAAANRGRRPGGLRYRAARMLETAALRRADAVTCICEGLKGDILARGVPASKVTVVPNAVDPARHRPADRPEEALAQRLGVTGRLVLGFFGSFYRYEGLHLLLEALPAIAARRSDIHLLLVGGGPEEARLRRIADETGLAARVTFAGRVPHDEVGRYYDLADLLVFPRLSLRLTELVTPLKPLEAMARERVVLASDVGGHRELIRDGDTGWLFPPDDPQALAAKVLECLDGRAGWPEMRARARRFVENERSWAASVARYREVYGRLTAR